MGCDPLIIPPDSGLDFAWRATVDVTPPISVGTVPRRGIPVLNIPRGRGYLELASRDVFVEWKAETWHDRIPQLDTPLTGPASRNGLWIQDGIVTLSATIYGAPRFAVDPQTGLVPTPALPINPQLTVIWHPGATPNDIENSWRFRAIVASDLRFPTEPLPNNRSIDMYCVGHARHWGFQSAQPLDLRVGTLAGTPIVGQPYRVAAGITTATGCASPWTCATLTNSGANPEVFNFTWDRFPMSNT